MTLHPILNDGPTAITPPPKGLSEKAGDLWRSVLTEYPLSDAELTLLETACRSLDLAELAEKQVAEQGHTFVDRFGQIKPHPSVAVARDARGLMMRALRQLDLDGVPDPQYRRR